jgi:hypothetical protein
MMITARQLRANSGLVEAARAEGAAAKGWYVPSPLPPQIVGLLVTLPPEPSPELMGQLQRDGFVRYSEDGVEPVSWAGTGDRQIYTELAGTWAVVKFEPASGIQRGSASVKSRPVPPGGEPVTVALPAVTPPATAVVRKARRQAPAERAGTPGGAAVEKPAALPAAPYTVAAVTPKPEVALHKDTAANVEAVVLSVVDVEGPVHEELVTRAVRLAYGQAQAGERSRDVIRGAIERLVRSGALACEEKALTTPGAPVVVRDRTALPDIMREARLLPASELRVAVLQHLAAFGPGSVERDDVVAGVAARLGYRFKDGRLAKSEVSRVIQAALGKLEHAGEVRAGPDGRVVLAEHGPPQAVAA